jgi:hypothetical protein
MMKKKVERNSKIIMAETEKPAMSRYNNKSFKYYEK